MLKKQQSVEKPTAQTASQSLARAVRRDGRPHSPGVRASPVAIVVASRPDIRLHTLAVRGGMALEARMTFTRFAATSAVLLPLAGACNRTDSRSEAPGLDQSCLLVVAAPAAGDPDIPKLQEDLRERRTASRAAEQLGYRFVARARVSHDPSSYAVAEQAAACLESMQPNDPAALLLRGHVVHQMHRFGEAEAIARRLVTMREFVLDFGLLGDALMEQGRVTEAADAYQKMIDLKPFYQSYTRAAHLRWLRGDLGGAIDMMQAAVKAASPRDPESIAWAYARLATYELQRGRLAVAARMVDASLRSVPDYAAALLARGRIQLAHTKPVEAVETLTRAAQLNPQPEYQWALADALRVLERTDEAAALEHRLVREGALADPRTVALFLSTRGQEGDRAIDLARRELTKRADIFTLDALAWALASRGQLQEASTLMARALAEGTEDGRLFVHAAVIAAADGRPADAARWADKARKLSFTLLPSELGVLRRGLATPPPV
jgi:tetratricopeptide (TPR) repeat protein